VALQLIKEDPPWQPAHPDALRQPGRDAVAEVTDLLELTAGWRR
jgi:hypothetical protein